MINELNKYFQSIGFVPQDQPDDDEWAEAEQYKDFLILPEFPNGGMIAISIRKKYTAWWWSIPTDLKGFGYHDDELAIAWCKEVIDGIPSEGQLGLFELVN